MKMETADRSVLLISLWSDGIRSGNVQSGDYSLFTSAETWQMVFFYGIMVAASAILRFLFSVKSSCVLIHCKY